MLLQPSTQTVRPSTDVGLPVDIFGQGERHHSRVTSARRVGDGLCQVAQPLDVGGVLWESTLQVDSRGKRGNRKYATRTWSGDMKCIVR